MKGLRGRSFKKAVITDTFSIPKNDFGKTTITSITTITTIMLMEETEERIKLIHYI